MDGKRGLLVGIGVVVVSALAVAAIWFLVLRDEGDDAAERRPGMSEGDEASALADAFGTAWTSGDWSKVAFTAASGDAPALTAFATAGLTPADGERPAKVSVSGLTRAEAAGGLETAKAKATVTWKLDADRSWTYDVDLPLVEEAPATGTGDPTWKVSWSPSVIAPGLQPGEVLQASRTTPNRGDVLDASGQALVGLRDVVVVGIQPSRSTDPAGTARTVAGLVDVDADALVDRVEKAPPDQFVEVVTLRKEVYDGLRDQLQPLPGTVFRTDRLPLAPSKDFARALLGTVGPATAEVVEASKGAIVAGDLTGLSGLQRSQNPTLAGTAGLAINAVAQGKEPRLIKDFPKVDGRSITVTLDQRVQIAADQVLAGTEKPSALVAIRVSTGDVLAVANGPSDASGYNRAMIGHYPPGSTFKVASGLTLLADGLTPDTVVDCPATIVVGKEFQNAEGEVLGAVPFRKDFADSCNTAFVGQSTQITPKQLADTAGLLGYRKLDVGAPVFGGSVPTDGDATEHAADMIGQGKVEASPFAVALASASVANGHSLTPRLIVDPKAPAPAVGAALPEPAVTQLRELMRGVVTDGTGGAVLGIPGGDVAGKTGTAEFGNESPPRTHAWFTGFQGDIAFAVLVEDGGFGGQAAAPLAADFLTRLAAGA